MADHEPTTHVACEEPALSDELRDALTLLRDRSDDDEFRTLVEDVLAGRSSLFDAAATPAFGAVVFGPVAQEFAERVGQAGDEQQDAVAESESDGAALCAALHQRALAGEAGAGAGPCAGCARLCATPCADPPQ
jgi:hypothetical protein